MNPYRATTYRLGKVACVCLLYFVGPLEASAEQKQRGQQGALERQRNAVRRQTGNSEATDSWFIVPWPNRFPLAPTPPTASPPSGSDQAQECDPLPAGQVRPLVDSAAEKAGLSTEFVMAVIEQESNFRPCAVSDKGAQGLMQLMPGTAQELGVDDPFDATANINGGVKYLKQMLSRFNNDVGLALSAYNAGEGRVAKDNKIPDIPETQRYVQEILKRVGSGPVVRGTSEQAVPSAGPIPTRPSGQ